MKKRSQTPSPIRKIEDTMFINNVQLNWEMSMTAPNFSEMNSVYMS
jgi:hypothetical protein